jgi:hypothetical protein
MSWKEFEEESPELASLGFEKLNRKIVYLAMIKKDGSPRLHPITPFIENGMLFMFTEPSSPKIRDLRRDGRYAMHCSVSREGPLIEYLISGNAEEISDSIVRKQAESIAAAPVVNDSYVLFEFRVKRVLVVGYDEEKNKVIRHWSAKEGK